MVKEMAAFGIPQDRIMLVVGCTLPTLHKHYRQELDSGMAEQELELVRNLAEIARGKDGTALKAIMFSLNTRFGWNQYAPAPKPGKKEQEQAAVGTAHEGNPWENILQ